MKPVPIILSTLSLGIIVGYLINSNFHSTDSAPVPVSKTSQSGSSQNITGDSPAINQLVIDIDEINQRLQQEISARQSLEGKLDNLSQQIASLERDDIHSQNNTGVENDSEEVAGAADSGETWFNEQALIDSGMSNSQAAELKLFFEQQELDRMYLRDQSVRENWDRQKYRDEIQKLSDNANSFLNQLDEQAYDAYLYASRQPNRVRVMSVLDSSQAGSAGIQAGDHIISYDNKRIYSGFELRSATTSGDINQTVAVEIERDGEIMELYLNRGPLGIRMNSVSIAPAS